jgi:ribosomal-protein-alanine N-acetyltransferase
METTTILETDRCIVRHWSLRDVDQAHAWLRDPDVHRFINPEAVCKTRDDSERVVRAAMDRQAKTGWNMWAVDRKSDGRLIGRAGIKHLDGGWAKWDAEKCARGEYELEVGYAYGKDVWRQGIASEVARALVDWGFREKKLRRIVGICLPENIGSRRVLENAGLIYEGQKPLMEGKLCDYLGKNAETT